jgi:hypothetical protein
VKRLLVIFSLTMLVACNPKIITTPVDEYLSGKKTSITFEIDPNETIIEAPRVTIFPKYYVDRVWDISALVKEDKQNQYSVQLPDLPPGTYRLAIDVPYQRIHDFMGYGNYNQTKYVDFTVHRELSKSCFSFDEKNNGTSGWSVSKVFISNSDKPVWEGDCPGYGLFHHNRSWPYSLDVATDGGSIFVPIIKECYPNTSPVSSQVSYWRFSLISPDLSNDPNWQNLSAFSFYVASKMVPVEFETRVEYVNQTSQADSAIPPNDLSISRKSYKLVSGLDEWVKLNNSSPINSKQKIKRIYIDVYGIPEETVKDSIATINFDAICPEK